MMMDDEQRAFLFETEEYTSAQGANSVLCEIESVASRAKALSVFTIARDMLGDEFYVDLFKKSTDMGIMATIHKKPNATFGEDSGEILLFFSHREELWRIPAYLSMKRAFSDEPWSDGLEFLEGTLLGYSEGQMTSRKKERERRRVGWLGPTCYFLLSHSQRDAIRRLGNRCFDPSSASEDTEVFFSTDNLAPKDNVHRLLPPGTSLCRASVKFGFFKNLFAHDIGSGRKVSFFVSTINSKNVFELNESLQSTFQFLGE